MKKFAILALSFLPFILAARRQEVFGRSFMLVRPASYNLAMDQQLWHNFVYTKEGPLYGGFQLIPFFQKSKEKDETARYFLINGKNRLLIAGDAQPADALKRDIRAEWINLPHDFHGTLSLYPEQEQIGFTFMYNQDLKNLFNLDFIKDLDFIMDWSIGIELPFIAVKNNIKLTQCDLQTTGTQPNTQRDIVSAFNQSAWKYGKISDQAQTKTRPEMVKFTVGRSVMSHDFFQLSSNISLQIPFAGHQDPEYLFSPVVGMDDHIGWGGAVFMQVLLNRDPKDFAWTFFLDLEGIYFFHKDQYRTYDLKGKPWSRYMQYTRRNSDPGVTVPGVNILTLKSKVKTYGIADFSMGWRVNAGIFEAEVGYGIWGFGGEKTELRSELNTEFNYPCEGLNIFGISGTGTITVQGQASQATASESTISSIAADDATFVGINENDIDLCSAQAGSILNHKGHIALGIEHIGDKMNAFGGFGAFIEYAQKNGSLSAWGLWFKVGGTF